MSEEKIGNTEMNNAKAWAIISTVVIIVGLVIAAAMFCLGMAVGQNGAKTEQAENCECEAKSS